MIRKITAGVLMVTLLAGGGVPQGQARGTGARIAVAMTRPLGRLGPLINIRQSWNNCGPASVAEVLDYWGIPRTQGAVAAVLRADGDPRGMAPFGIPAYARTVGLRSLLGVYGTPRLLKALVSNGFPVIVNQWISMYDHYRHYRPIEAYDDHQGVFVSSDPYLGPDHRLTYDDFAVMWKVSNQRFTVLYPLAKEGMLQAVLDAAGWDRTQALQRDLANMEARLRGEGPSEPSWGLNPHMYPYLNLAWDDLQLGHYAAARAALRAAAAAGAHPLVVQWVTNEMPSAPES